MTLKTTGAEFKRFYNDEAVWKGEAFHEGELLTVDGVEIENGDIDYNTLKDEEVITVSGGVIYVDQEASAELGTFESVMRKWRKAQTTETIVVEVAKDKLEAVRAAIKAAGGKVLK